MKTKAPHANAGLFSWRGTGRDFVFLRQSTAMISMSSRHLPHLPCDDASHSVDDPYQFLLQIILIINTVCNFAAQLLVKRVSSGGACPENLLPMTPWFADS